MCFLIRISIVLAVIISVGGCATSQMEYDWGVEDYSKGNYAAAITRWKGLADEGYPPAEHALGHMAETGKGVNVDPNVAANWYARAAKHGWGPAMARLGYLQVTYGYKANGYGWLNYASRLGNDDAVRILRAFGQPVPEPDLLRQQQVNERQAQARQSEADAASMQAAGALGYAVGCALAGGCVAPPMNYPDPASSNSSLPADRSNSSAAIENTQRSSVGECSSDYNCGVGYTCVKGYSRNQGICKKSVDGYGNRVFNPPDSGSFGPNLNPTCSTFSDCPTGFHCDTSVRACVRW